MEDSLQVWWRGTKIGVFEVTEVDMWTLHGHWHPDASTEARQFETLVETFKYLDINRGLEKGTRIVLRTNDASPGTNALVMLPIKKNLLMVRQVINEKAVEWLINNVN